MTPFLIFGALLALLMTGIPVAFTLGILGAGLLAIDGLPLSMVASTLFGGRFSRRRWQRLRTVGSSRSGSALVSSRRIAPGGSSKVFKSALKAFVESM